MITTELPEGVAFRSHNPRWSFDPMSGKGAAGSGGRFNRVGIPALYLSLDEQTSAAEYKQDDIIPDPYLMVAYTFDLPPLVDLRLLDGTWDELWKDWNCDWRAMFVEGLEPPSWLLGDMVLSAGHVGLIFPSMVQPSGLNLVLYTDLLKPEWLKPHDPNNKLPADQKSWPSK